MKYDMILKKLEWENDVLFSSVFLTILQIFSLEFTLIRDQGWINVSTYGPMCSRFDIFVLVLLNNVDLLRCKCKLSAQVFSCWICGNFQSAIPFSRMRNPNLIKTHKMAQWHNHWSIMMDQHFCFSQDIFCREMIKTEKGLLRGFFFYLSYFI